MTFLYIFHLVSFSHICCIFPIELNNYNNHIMAYIVLLDYMNVIDRDFDAPSRVSSDPTFLGALRYAN